MKNKRLIKIAPLLALTLSSCGVVHYEPKDYILEMAWKENFKILQLNDIHIGAKDDQEVQFMFLDKIIEQAENPDLIIICGDLFTFGNRATAKRTFKWLDSHKIPWTVTWGNHDEQCTYSIDWVTGYLNNLNDLRATGESYCVFKDIQDDDVMGNANFAINLMNGNTIEEQIIVMDSNRYNFGEYQGEKEYEEYIGYDAFHEDQVQWYKDLVKYTKTQNGGTPVSSLAFFHIPLPEYEDAWNEYNKDGEPKETDNVKLVQSQCPTSGEGIACPKINTGMFDAMLEGESTKGVFVAHDHKNNWALEYKGITLSFGVNSSDRVYFSEDLLGGQTITVHADKTFSIDQFSLSYDLYKELND